MKLKLFPCVEAKAPMAVIDIQSKIMSETDDKSLAQYLDTLEPDRHIDQVDLIYGKVKSL